MGAPRSGVVALASRTVRSVRMKRERAKGRMVGGPGYAAAMEDRLGRGVYDHAEASYLLNVTSEALARLTLPGADGSSPLVECEFPDGLLSFRDLVAVAIVAELLRQRYSIAQVRVGLANLERRFGSRPLACREVLERVGMSGVAFLLYDDGSGEYEDVHRPGQLAMASAVEPYFELFSFDEQGFVTSWRPASGVVLDPEIQCGAPCIEGTRITTDLIAGLVDEGMTEREIATMYDLGLADIEAALKFEALLLTSGLSLSRPLA